jgi:hypothetical protein
VPDDALRISDGEFVYRIADPKLGSLRGDVLEISPVGVLIRTKHQFDANAYETVLDVMIELKGQMSRQFFASVVGNEAGGARLSWLNIDPGQAGRLKILLDAYRARYLKKEVASTVAQSPTGEGIHKTRRMIKPSAQTPAPKPAGGMVITPFGGADPTPGGTPVLKLDDEPAANLASGTQRVKKPTTQPLSLFGEGGAADAPSEPPRDPGDDSKAHSVVIAPTAQFVKVSTEQPVQVSSVEEEDPAESGKMVVGQDGRMDIGATLRSKAKTVRASELAARHDKVRVLNLATIRALIQEAVEDAASHLSRALSEADRKRLLEEAEEGFQERMKAFQMEKASADERSKKLADQLQMAQKLLEDERKRSITSDQFTVSASGLGELEGGFQKLIDRAMAEGKLDGGLEEQLRKLASRVFDEERQRIREKEMQAQNDKIELLEKKIKRLAGNLDEAERQRDEAREIAQALESMGGQGLSMEQIKSKYKIGLAKDDPRREAKLAIMKELLDENRDLRRKLGIQLNEVKPAAKPVESAPEPTPEPVLAETEGATAEADQANAAAVDGGAELANPDDEPWSPDGDAGGASETSPDDEPWEPPADAGPKEDGEIGGVKILRSFKNFEPPPLIKK